MLIINHLHTGQSVGLLTIDYAIGDLWHETDGSQWLSHPDVKNQEVTRSRQEMVLYTEKHKCICSHIDPKASKMKMNVLYQKEIGKTFPY